jgi:hypothetical protein
MCCRSSDADPLKADTLPPQFRTPARFAGKIQLKQFSSSADAPFPFTLKTGAYPQRSKNATDSSCYR